MTPNTASASPLLADLPAAERLAYHLEQEEHFHQAAIWARAAGDDSRAERDERHETFHREAADSLIRAGVQV